MYRNEDIVNAHQGRTPCMSNTVMIRSPTQRELGEWPLHKINLQIDAKQVQVLDSISTCIDGELG